MTDEEFLFRQTEKERKRIGRGDYNKKRQGGKTIRFPSDYLTKKERDSMNGDTKTYQMEKPVAWSDFKLWPEDLQRSYLLGLREKFCADDEDVGKMFGIARPTVSIYKKKLGISSPRGGRKHKLREAEWNAFLGVTAPVEETPAAVEETPAAVEETPIPDPQPAELKFTESDFSMLYLAELLISLKGSGAKLTFEVTL